MTSALGSARRRGNPQRGGIILRFLFLVFLLAVMGVLYLVRHPIMRLAGEFLVVDDSPRASDAIVVMGDDDYDADTAARAAELMKAGWAPRVVASGRFLRPYASIADLIQRDLLSRGVPSTAIVKFASHADDTREEAQQLGAFLTSHGWKKIVVVTANFKTRRTRHILERTLGEGSELHVIAARDSGYDPDNWWSHRGSMKNFFLESLAYLTTLWKMRHTEPHTT
jgi:uncharacterized SAM-binding protein YcdF (DUF218 family)